MNQLADMSSVSTADLIAAGILEIGDGYRAKNIELGDQGLPFARVQNLKDGFDFSDADRYPESALGRVGAKVSQVGDCVLTTKGTVGRVGFVTSTTSRFVYSPQLSYWRSLDWSKLDTVFLRYWLHGPEFLEQCNSVKGATDMADYVNLRDQRRMQITIPPLLTQCRIASILSAYDDLIENNIRRIQILEAMAQAIYREWFVEFRFPGHEGGRMVDSELGPIPEGWKILRLGDMVDVNARVIRGGNDLQDINYIDISAVAQGEFGWTNMEYAVAPGRARRLVASCDVIWSTVRPNLRAYALICEPPSNCVASTGFAVLTARAVPWSYLFAVVTTDAFVSYLVNHATGSAYPAVTGRTFEQAPLIVPDENSVAAFHRGVGPMHQLVAKLRSMSRNLRQTRDLLLPRLISGEIDVSGLDLGDV